MGTEIEKSGGSRGAAAWLGFTNGVILLFGLAHMVRVTMKAMEREEFYDYRLYSLYLLGGLLIAPSWSCLTAVGGIKRGAAAAWSRAWRGTLLLILVCAPAIPFDIKAGAFPYAPWNSEKLVPAVVSLTVVLLLINVLILVLARPSCRREAEAVAS